jgi:hypothetical protein
MNQGRNPCVYWGFQGMLMDESRDFRLEQSLDSYSGRETQNRQIVKNS